MARIVYIRDDKEKKLLCLGIEEAQEQTRYFISYALYARLGRPVRNEEISSSAMTDIKYCDECYRAKKKALSYLAVADNNERELVLKLLHAGFRRDIAEQTVEEMVGLGYIDETRQLERLISREAKVKLSGPRKICARLGAKGYSLSNIKDVIRALVESGEIDFDSIKDELCARKLADPCDVEEKKKLLYKYGF
ncbi:MAG: RecX family transcriptional regulator [Clostridia bacterium]|nr:RecX family transcriptional regulator [Clostridia bacterium]